MTQHEAEVPVGKAIWKKRKRSGTFVPQRLLAVKVPRLGRSSKIRIFLVVISLQFSQEKWTPRILFSSSLGSDFKFWSVLISEQKQVPSAKDVRCKNLDRFGFSKKWPILSIITLMLKPFLKWEILAFNALSWNDEPRPYPRLFGRPRLFCPQAFCPSTDRTKKSKRTHPQQLFSGRSFSKPFLRLSALGPLLFQLFFFINCNVIQHSKPFYVKPFLENDTFSSCIESSVCFSSFSDDFSSLILGFYKDPVCVESQRKFKLSWIAKMACRRVQREKTYLSGKRASWGRWACVWSKSGQPPYFCRRKPHTVAVCSFWTSIFPQSTQWRLLKSSSPRRFSIPTWKASLLLVDLFGSTSFRIFFWDFLSDFFFLEHTHTHIPVEKLPLKSDTGNGEICLGEFLEPWKPPTTMVQSKKNFGGPYRFLSTVFLVLQAVMSLMKDPNVGECSIIFSRT